MTQEEIIEMAREAGLAYNQSLCEVNTPFCDGVGIEDLERFFHMAQVAEREACAKVVLGIANKDAGNPYKQALRIGAEAIRARGQK